MRKPVIRRFWRVSRPLRLRELVTAFHGGATDIPWEAVRDRVNSVVVEGAGLEREDRGATRRGDALASVVQTEMGETANEHSSLKAKLEQKAQRKAAAIQARDQIRATVSTAGQSLPSKMAFAGILGIGEFGNSAWSVADALGIDVTGQPGDVSASSYAIVISTAVVVTVVNGVAGSLATSAHSPRRRLGGWLLLLVIALALAGIRSAVAADVSAWLMLLSFAISLLAGLAAGVAHRALAATLDVRRSHRKCLHAAEEAAAAAATDLASVEGAVRAAAARRRALAVEADDITAPPRSENEASDDLAQIRQARAHQARYWFLLGQRFAGRGQTANGKEDARA